jgi:hypothetical protein
MGNTGWPINGERSSDGPQAGPQHGESKGSIAEAACSQESERNDIMRPSF